MGLQRRLYGIYEDFLVSCNYKPVSFVAKSLSNIFNDFFTVNTKFNLQEIFGLHCSLILFG